MAAFALLFMACSGGADPVEDDGSSFNNDGGAAPDQTQICEDQCLATDPNLVNGEGDYRAVRACQLCDACYLVCQAEGVNVGACPAVEVDACSQFVTTCADCVNSQCALFQNPTTSLFEGLCSVQGDTCANNTSCVGMTNCVEDCVATAPPAM